MKKLIDSSAKMWRKHLGMLIGLGTALILNECAQTFTEDKIIPICLQTHDQSNYKAILNDGLYPVLVGFFQYL